MSAIAFPMSGLVVLRGVAVFEDGDPDYQALPAAFAPCHDRLVERPPLDMPGAQPGEIDRSCL